MSDLISRQAAIDAVHQEFDECLVWDESGQTTADEVERILDYLPSADAVQVVRCKDCLWGKEVCGNIECSVNDYAEPMYHGYYWYCANGEREDDVRSVD